MRRSSNRNSVNDVNTTWQLRTGLSGGCLRSIAQRTRSGARSYWIGLDSQLVKLAESQSHIYKSSILMYDL